VERDNTALTEPAYAQKTACLHVAAHRPDVFSGGTGEKRGESQLLAANF